MRKVKKIRRRDKNSKKRPDWKMKLDIKNSMISNNSFFYSSKNRRRSSNNKTKWSNSPRTTSKKWWRNSIKNDRSVKWGSQKSKSRRQMMDGDTTNLMNGMNGTTTRKRKTLMPISSNSICSWRICKSQSKRKRNKCRTRWSISGEQAQTTTSSTKEDLNYSLRKNRKKKRKFLPTSKIFPRMSWSTEKWKFSSKKVCSPLLRSHNGWQERPESPQRHHFRR